MVDADFIEKRFGSEIASYARGDGPRIRKEAVEELKKRVASARAESPWLPQDALVHVRFPLSPYVVAGFASAYAFGNLLAPTFSFFKRLFS